MKRQILAKLQKLTTAQIDLHRATGHGYWYFTYTREATDTAPMMYETETIYCVRLNDMTVQRWIEYGAAFIEYADAEYIERNA